MADGELIGETVVREMLSAVKLRLADPGPLRPEVKQLLSAPGGN